MELTNDEKERIVLEERYRLEVRQKLQSSPGTSLLWKTLNSPFALWALSSIALAGVSTAYSNMSASNLARAEHKLKLNSLVVDALSRIEPMRYQAAVVRGEVERVSATFGSIVEVRGIYPEFDNRNFRSIAFEIGASCANIPEAVAVRSFSDQLIALGKKDNRQAAIELAPMLEQAHQALTRLKTQIHECK